MAICARLQLRNIPEVQERSGSQAGCCRHTKPFLYLAATCSVARQLPLHCLTDELISITTMLSQIISTSLTYLARLIATSIKPAHDHDHCRQVKRDHHELFKQYAPIWAKEEVERANLWTTFLLSFAPNAERYLLNRNRRPPAVPSGRLLSSFAVQPLLRQTPGCSLLCRIANLMIVPHLCQAWRRHSRPAGRCLRGGAGTLQGRAE